MIPSSKIFARIPRHFVQILFQTPFVRYSIKKLFLTKNIYISTFLLQKLEIFERDRLFPANEQCDISFVTSPYLREPSLRQAGREKKSDRCSSSLPRDDHFHRWREETRKNIEVVERNRRGGFFSDEGTPRACASSREAELAPVHGRERPRGLMFNPAAAHRRHQPATSSLAHLSPFPRFPLHPTDSFLSRERERDKDCTRVDNEKIEVSRKKG